MELSQRDHCCLLQHVLGLVATGDGGGDTPQGPRAGRKPLSEVVRSQTPHAPNVADTLVSCQFLL